MALAAPLLLAALAQAPAGADFADPAATFVAVVLDDSGSMADPMPGAGESKMEVAKAALAEVVAGLPGNARVSLFPLNAAFLRDRAARFRDDDRGGGAFAAGEVDAATVRRVLDGLARPVGGTPLGERLAEAAAALAAARADNKYGTYRLLVVTDGEATDPAAVDAALPRALGAGLTVDVIGVGMRGDHSLATRVDSYRRADDPAALSAAMNDVLAETTGAADDGAADDYDLIAPLPEPLAAAVLTALADDRIGADGAGPDRAAPADRLPPPVRNRGPVPRPPPGGDEFNPLGGLCCCLGVLAVLGAVAFRVVGTLLGGGPRRRRYRRR